MFKRLKFNHSSVLSVILIIIVAGVLIEYIYALFYATIDSDAGYCLSLARDITNNKILYKDVVLHYTPLIIYLFSLIKILSASFYNYTLILLFQFIVIVFDSILVYKISSFFTNKKLLRYYGVVATLLLFFRYDGIFLELEPFVVFFSLISIYLVLKAKDKKLYFILAGITCGLSFFSKQFGIIIFIPLSIFILIFAGDLKKSIGKLFYLAIGGVIPLSLFLLYYNVIYDIKILRLFDILTGEGVERFSENHYFHTMRNFIFYNGLFLIFIPVYVAFSKAKNLKYPVLFILLFLTFSVIFLLGTWDHFKQLLIPYVVLMGLFIFDKSKEFPALSNFFKLLIFSCFLFIVVSNIKYFTNNYRTWERQKQYQIAYELLSYIPEHSKVLCLNKQAYIYLCNYQSVDPKFSGYPFIRDWDESRVHALLKKTKNLIYYKEFVYKKPGYLKELLNEFGFVNTNVTPSGFYIWQKND